MKSIAIFLVVVAVLIGLALVFGILAAIVLI